MSEEGHMEAWADIPDDQRFTWCLTPLPGRLLDASTVGKTLDLVCATFREKDMTGRRLFPALLGVKLTEGGAFEVEVALLPVERKLSPAEPPPFGPRTPHPGDDTTSD